MKIMHHISLLSVALGAALALSSAAQACTLNAWTTNGAVEGAPVAGGPAAAAPNNTIRRYSGICGMRATGSGNNVRNDDPTNDQIFRARFYVYTSNTGATATVYNAGPDIVTVDLIGNTGIRVTPAGGTAMNFTTVANKWYSVEIAMNATATATTGADPIPANTVRARVAGNGSDTVTALTSAVTTASAITSAKLGCISGCTGNVDFDAYESTRSGETAIGRLCRGDANSDNTRSTADIIQIRNEFLTNGTTAASGTPDFNEDGTVSTADSLQVRNLFLAGQGACS